MTGRGPDRGPHVRHRREQGRPRGREPRIDRPRRVAYEAVAAVQRDGAYANLILPRLLHEQRVVGRDAAFATELAYGTLRTMGQLDAVLASAAGRPVERIDPPARDALRLGAYQLLHMRVPAHAAVATTVDIVRATFPAAAGFANAVLRTVGERDLPGWLAALEPADRAAKLALDHAHPQWIVRAFADSLGGDLDETERALAADNERPLVHLAARPGRITQAELAAEAGGEPGRFSPLAVYLPSGAPGDLPAIGAGLAQVQDEGSQLVTLALAEAELAGPDAAWLDLCAGPGGKAALLGGLAVERGAEVTAVEVAPHRARLVERAVEGLPVTVVVGDGREIEGQFDRVLVDAPCTGLGALRRRPEARWRRQPTDLPPLTGLQRELLGAAIRATRPGGLVAYVTCSPHLAETRVTVAEAVRRAPAPVELIDARPYIPADAGDGPTVQLWPHRHGTDAMFLALLRVLPC